MIQKNRKRGNTCPNIFPPSPNKKAALLLLAGILLLSIISICVIVLPLRIKTSSGYLAQIYQNGERIQEIQLTPGLTPYEFTITGESGRTNTIRIKGDRIGIIDADCPDKLCVKQGFIRNDILPITCLPNRLVVQLKAITLPSTAPDIITH